MNIFRLAFAPVLAVCLAVPAAAEIPLGTLSSYLNSITTAQSDFTQVNADGTVSTGKVSIRKPGRVRFEYDKDKTLVLASGGTVAVIDPKSNQPPQQYPLSRTPLSIILASNVDLSRARMITGHSSNGDKTIITAQDPDHPDYGSIDLVFTDNPVALRQWTVTDNAGTKTTVILQDMKTGMDLGQQMFSISSALN